ncbi:sugar phosphate isomerase/epimerase family protein [Coraliomargarita parva]|uniref:sugar phosphate isomerase/epimerase family protein n=1 Tax=Coraliomargarita parva TaxID=3014050 RepID=UPI0022B32140|nr:sugar phosphate isomerase/epimerase family protein [Coraliomargarita parva]
MRSQNEIIGICTWNLGIKDLDLMMSTIAGLGLTGVQFCGSYREFEAAEVKAAAAANGLALIIYDPFDCHPGPKNGEATFENAISYYDKAIDFAAELGVGQTLQGLSAWTKNCRDQQGAWTFLSEALRSLSSYANGKGVPLSYEPCNLYEVPYIHTAAEYQQLIDASGCTDIQILLDSFHMNIGEPDPLKTLEVYASRNSVFHLSDSNREGIGRGHIDFGAYLNALRRGGFEGPYVVECVLKGNPVNTPPRNDAEMAQLTSQIRESVEAWKALQSL